MSTHNHNFLVVHCRQNTYDKYVGRSNDLELGKWGNPFTHIKNKHTLAEFVVDTVEEAVISYLQWLPKQLIFQDLHELEHQVLGCWCGNFGIGNWPNNLYRCHAQGLWSLANL